MDDRDAQTYAKAVANVARHYDIRAAQKTVDWINLLGMVAFIEGTRVVAGRAARQPKPQAPPAPRGQVFQFSPPPRSSEPGKATPPGQTTTTAPTPQPEPFGPPFPDGPAEAPDAPEGPFH